MLLQTQFEKCQTVGTIKFERIELPLVEEWWK